MTEGRKGNGLTPEELRFMEAAVTPTTDGSIPWDAAHAAADLIDSGQAGMVILLPGGGFGWKRRLAEELPAVVEAITKAEPQEPQG